MVESQDKTVRTDTEKDQRKDSVPLNEQAGTDKRTATQENETGAETLDEIPLFSTLPQETLRDLEKTCRWCEFREGVKVLERGEDSRDVYFILSGDVHVLNFAGSGRVIDFAILGPGDFFGELAAIDAQPRSATVVAKSPCRMVAIPHQAFLALVTSYPDITLTVLNRLATVVRLVDERITDISVLDAEQRVCIELLRLATPDPIYFDNYDRLVVYPVPTQKRMARNIGVARETVARIFGRLSGDGIIERKAKTLYIRNKPALESLALPFEE